MNQSETQHCERTCVAAGYGSVNTLTIHTGVSGATIVVVAGYTVTRIAASGNCVIVALTVLAEIVGASIAIIATHCRVPASAIFTSICSARVVVVASYRSEHAVATVAVVNSAWIFIAAV